MWAPSRNFRWGKPRGDRGRFRSTGGLLGHGDQGEGFRVADAAIHGVRRFGGLGGVLGDVVGDGLFSGFFALALLINRCAQRRIRYVYDTLQKGSLCLSGFPGLPFQKK